MIHWARSSELGKDVLASVGGSVTQLDEARISKPPDDLSEFGTCAMTLARKKGFRTQVAMRRALKVTGYEVKDRTLANYLYGRSVVDPALPIHLAVALKLNKKERRELADAYTYGQPPRGERPAQIGA